MKSILYERATCLHNLLSRLLLTFGADKVKKPERNFCSQFESIWVFKVKPIDSVNLGVQIQPHVCISPNNRTWLTY